MARPSRFVVLFAGRTGSTWLMDTLKRQDDLKIGMEELVWPLHRYETERARAEQLAFTETFYTQDIPDGTKAVGFKTKLKDVVDQDAFGALLKSLDVQVIRMGRRNEVKAAISAINAKRQHEMTGRWNRWEGDAGVGALRVELVDLFYRLERRRAAERMMDAWLGANGLEAWTLFYEDMFADPKAAIGSLARHIGAAIDTDVLSGSVVKKITSNDLRDAIENFDMVEQALIGTPFAGQLTDDPR